MLELNEPIVRALHERLLADLNDAIAQINAQVTDEILIDPHAPEQILDFVPAIESLGVGFPVVGIQDLPGRFENDIGSSLDGRFELGIVVFECDPEVRRLGWKLRRKLRAVASVALDDRRLGDAHSVVARGTLPGPTFERIPDPTDDGEREGIGGRNGPLTYASWSVFVLSAVREDDW